jgi:BirA family biotin operon repressor/biotin-[acetyl-CoA-carboxylase] ligase
LGLEAGIKWPNDLLIRGRKICGILMEVSAEVGRLDYAVVGLGINANVRLSSFPDEWMSTSLAHESGHDVNRRDLIQRILMDIEEAYEVMGSNEIYKEWRHKSITLGRCVRITSSSGALLGVVEDLFEDGTLLLRTDSGLQRVLAGDCIHLRPVEAV